MASKCDLHTLIRLGSVVLAMSPLSSHAASMNPISRIARIFDGNLVQLENRLFWLDGMLQTLAKPSLHTLKTDLGYRGTRTSPNDPAPTITLDLGQEYPITAVFLVPSQEEFTGDPGISPKRITLECSTEEAFSSPILIHKTLERDEEFDREAPNLYPVHATARYVRLTVDEGVVRQGLEIFGLSEIMVCNDDYPVSFGAKVTASGGTQTTEIWNETALVDGKTPLGIWQSGSKPGLAKGDAVTRSQGNFSIIWTTDLATPEFLDHVILYPYEVNKAFGAFIFPESIRLNFLLDGEMIHSLEWTNPSPGGSHLTPLVFPLHGLEVDEIVITAAEPWVMGDQYVCALSEIEAWSRNQNVIFEKPVIRTYRSEELPILSLTDGFTSSQKILPAGEWMSQLVKRDASEEELVHLRPRHRSMESRSELNATWGVAVMLGLTFLLPVFVVERRRLTSRKNLTDLRSRIASDLHDDIGSNLGSISLIARSTRKELMRNNGPEEVVVNLAEMEAIARESALAMRDIVWLLERQQDSIGDLYQRMKETANRLLRETEFTIDSALENTSCRLSLDAKRHLFLFYKEAIHNVIKHAKASRVNIRLWDEKDTLVIEVKDNGIGIKGITADSPTPSLSKLDERTRMLGGTLNIESAPDQGTCIRLCVKRSYLANAGA